MKSTTLRWQFAKTLLLGLSVSTVSFADNFDDQDSNQDGVLSGTEVAGLKMLDQDGDGEVSRAEFTTAANEQRSRATGLVGRIFKERDTNGDGKLSGTESKGLEFCDANQDRRISEAELRESLSSEDLILAGKSFKEITEMANKLFDELDTTGDGRLTGTESIAALHYDQNADGRIMKEEFVLGQILSSSSGKGGQIKPTVPAAIADDILVECVAAINNPSTANSIRKRMHPELQKQVDLLIFSYAVIHANNSHGTVELIASGIQEEKLATGEKKIEAKLKCEKGQLILNLQTLKGQITSFSLDSPEMLTLDKGLHSALQGDSYQGIYSTWYGQIASDVLTLILDGKDDEAIKNIHPSVIEQIGQQPFNNVFTKLRTHVNKANKTELEKFSTDVSEKGVHTFTITHLVTGDKGSLEYSTTFQRVGLHASMTGIAIANGKSFLLPPKEESPQPAPVAPPAPAPAPPPAPLSMPATPNADGSWIETVSKENGVAFQMPGKTAVEGSEDSKHFFLELPEKGMKFDLDVVSLDPTVDWKEDLFFKVYKNILVEKRGAEILIEKNRTFHGFPEQSLFVRTKNGKFAIIRNILDGKINYRGMWTGPDIEEDSRNVALKFIESIKVIDNQGAPKTGSKGQSSTPAAPPPAFPK